MTSKGILRPVTNEHMQELFIETPETLATGINLHKNTFTAAKFSELELWKMRKAQKSATAQRRFF